MSTELSFFEKEKLIEKQRLIEKQKQIRQLFSERELEQLKKQKQLKKQVLIFGSSLAILFLFIWVIRQPGLLAASANATGQPVANVVEQTAAPVAQLAFDKETEPVVLPGPEINALAQNVAMRTNTVSTFDNSVVTTSYDAYGTKIEKRGFRDHPRLFTVVIETRPDGTKAGKAISRFGELREIPEKEAAYALSSSPDQISDAVGFDKRFEREVEPLPTPDPTSSETATENAATENTATEDTEELETLPSESSN